MATIHGLNAAYYQQVKIKDNLNLFACHVGDIA